MLAGQILSEQIIPLKKADLCEAAIDLMNQIGLYELPVVEQGKLVGYLTLSNALKNQHQTVGKAMNIECHFAFQSLHLFDLTKLMVTLSVSTIAVCSDDHTYMGCVTALDIVKVYGNNNTLALPGAIVTLEISPRDYTLTELARITESNNLKIVGVNVVVLPNQQLEVNLKFNSTEVGQLLHTFERYSYQIKAVHQINQNTSDFSNRLDWLIKFINT